MASNFTEHYGFNQWERTDKVLMEDFNADNAKVDALLRRVEERIAVLDRLTAKLIFHTGRLALSDVEQTKMALFTGSSINEQFLYSDHLNLTGGVTAAEGMVVLEGAETVGGVSVTGYLVPDTEWSQAIMWLEQTTGSVSAWVNNTPMEPGRSFRVFNADGRFHTYQEYTCTGLSPKSTADVALELRTGSNNDLRVYSYSVLFF